MSKSTTKAAGGINLKSGKWRAGGVAGALSLAALGLMGLAVHAAGPESSAQLAAAAATLSPSSSPTASPSVSPTPPPSASPSATAPSGASDCASTALAVAPGQNYSGMATSVWMIVLTNVGASGCDLEGTPTVQFQGLGDSALATVQQDGSFSIPGVSAVPNQVELAPGASASFVLVYSDAAAVVACPQASELVIGLPGAAGTIDMPTDFAPCTSQITVSPIMSGISLP